MVRRLFFLLTVAFAMCCQADAQEQADSASVQPQRRKLSAFRRMVRAFSEVDTDYIEPQHYAFTTMVEMNSSYNLYKLNAKSGQSVTFSPDRTVKVGPYFGWKWLFAGYLFDLNTHTARVGQNLDLSIYASQIGIDLFYHYRDDNYNLQDVDLGEAAENSDLEGTFFNGLNTSRIGFNIYYIFNHRHFSYPAAFAQSTIQKRSCGSWMAGLGYNSNSVSLDHEQLQELLDRKTGKGVVQLDSALMFSEVKYRVLNFSGGYGYNWVFAKNCLLAGSAQLSVAYKKSVGEGDESNSMFRGFNIDNVNLDLIGRFALVYNNMRWYAGASWIVYSNNYRKMEFSTNNTFGTINAYVGYNFGMFKKYRKKK